MATDLKNLKRLETLLTAFDSEVVQPEELIQAMEAVTEIITQSGKLLSDKIDQTGEAKTGEIRQLESKLDSVSNQLANLINEVRNDSSLDAGDIRQLVATEIKRIEQSIPVLPDEFDASDIQASLLEHKSLLDGLSILVIGENVRNALEALPVGDKLAIDAIEGLTDALAKRQEQLQNATAIIAHRLDQIGNVAIAGATNGQALVYQAATDRWIPGSGGGGITSVVGGTNVTINNTDPNNPIISASVPGGSGITRSVNNIVGNTTAGSVGSTDYDYNCTGALTLTLPTAVGNTNKYSVTRISGLTTVATTSSQTINGSANATLTINNMTLTFISDGANWNIK